MSELVNLFTSLSV